jgi:ParB/RepB/Spo0J family partition protein
MTTIPVSQISDPAWNSRLLLDEAKTRELASSIKARIEAGRPGLMNPITVTSLNREPTEHFQYQLIAGSRRLAAYKILGIKEIPATVEVYANDDDKSIDNIIENLQRVDLTTYEQARAYAQLRRAGLKLREVKEKTGVSESHISKMVSAYETLPEEIHKPWQAGSPVCTTDFLQTLVLLKDPDKAITRYNEQLKLYKKMVDSDDGEEKPKSQKESRVKRAYQVKLETYAQLRKTLARVKADVITKQMMLDAVDFLVGEKTKIEGVANPLGSDEESPPKSEKKSTTKKGK